MTNNIFTNNFSDISTFKKIQLWTEPTKLWKILWTVWLSKLVQEKANYVCIALATYHNWRSAQLRTPYIEKLITGTKEEIYAYLNTDTTRIIKMDLMSASELARFHDIEKKIHQSSSIIE